MKSNRGITLSSLIIYIIALIVLAGTMSTLVKYFYGNLEEITIENRSAKEYTKFTNYLSSDINSKKVQNVFVAEDKSQITIKFNDYTIHRYKASDGSIYYLELKENIQEKKVRLCENVKTCEFTLENDVLNVFLEFEDNRFNNSYAIK